MNRKLVSLCALGVVLGVGGVAAAYATIDRLADDRADDRVADLFAGYELGEVNSGDGARLDALIEQALSKSASNRECPSPEEPDPPRSAEPVGAELVAMFDQPTWVTVDSTGRELVIERGGRVVELDTGDVIVDVSSTTRVEHDSGLMGAAVDDEWLYLFQSSWIDPPSGTRSTRILAVDLGAGAEGEPAIIFETQVPTGQHAGGGIAIGPDGMLWFGLGDGGGLGDPRANGQDPTVLLGKLLRIDPRPEDGDYTIPPDNPFADASGGAAPEVVALGLRNPWRLAFDVGSDADGTEALWFGDVGQSCWEEIDTIANSGNLEAPNFGWDLREAFEPFQAPPVPPEDDVEVVDPVHAYHHRGGQCAVATGYVYRGSADVGRLPEGSVLFTDYCGSEVYALTSDPTGVEVIALGVDIPTPVAVVPDSEGEPLVVSLWADGETQEGGGIYRLTSP